MNMAVNCDAITSFLRNKGPSTPIDIARALGENSLIISAVLVDFEGQGKVRVSKRRFGNVKLYYLPEQQGRIEKMVSNTLTPEEKVMLERIMNEKTVSELDLSAQETSMIATLEDLIPPFAIQHENYRLRCWRVPAIEEGKAIEIVVKRIMEDYKDEPAEEKEEPAAPVEEKEEPKPEPVKVETTVQEPAEPTATEPPETVVEEPEPLPKPEPPKKEKQQKLVEPGPDEDFRTTVRSWFESNEIDVEEERELEDGKVYEYDINMPTAIGKQGYIAKIIINKKKPAGQGEVSSFGTYVATKRVPGVLISNTGFAKSAVKYWKKELSDIIMLVSNEDLEN